MVARDVGDDGVYGCGGVGECPAGGEDLGRWLGGSCGGDGGEWVGEEGAALWCGCGLSEAGGLEEWAERAWGGHVEGWC